MIEYFKDKYMATTTIILVLLALNIAGCAQIPKTTAPLDKFQFNQSGVSLEAEVLLPASYGKLTDKKYPVIYLLDGYWNRDSIKETYNALRFDNMIPEVIIVSIGYPSKVTDYETQRMWDLTPAYDSGFKAGGNGALLLDLLANKVVPFMESNYPIDKHRTILTGHSLAGLFTLYAMYERPATFTHYAAISPSALWAKNKLAQIDQAYFKKSSSIDTHLYITYETHEYLPYVTALEDYVKQLEGRSYKMLNLKIAPVKGMGHVSMKAEGFTRAIAWALSDIKPEGPSEFEKKNVRALNSGQ